MKYLILSLCFLVVLSGCPDAGTGTYADSIATYDEYVSYLIGAWGVIDEETGESLGPGSYIFTPQGEMSVMFIDGSISAPPDFELRLEGGRMYWMWDYNNGNGQEYQFYMEIESKDRFRIRPMTGGETEYLERR